MSRRARQSQWAHPHVAQRGKGKERLIPRRDNAHLQAKSQASKAGRKGMERIMLLDGRTAAISGAASARGIGLATAKLFAQHGARIAILDIDAAAAKAAAQALGPKHVGIGCDVADKASCDAAAQVVLNAFGHLDVLINNAASPSR